MNSDSLLGPATDTYVSSYITVHLIARARNLKHLESLIRIDSGFLEAVGWPGSETVCNLDFSITPALLVSPSHWSIPKQLNTSLLKRYTPHSSRSGSNCPAHLARLTTIPPLQVVYSPLSHSKNNPSTLRICLPLTLTIHTGPTLET